MPRPSKKNLPKQNIFSNSQDILNNAPEGIFNSTLEGRFLSVNPALARMIGYNSPQDMIHSITDIATQLYADPSDRQKLQRQIEMHGQVQNFECRFLKRDGSSFWCSTNAQSVLDENGEINHYQGFITNITERKKVEEVLRESLARYDELVANVPVGVYIFWIRADGHLEFEYVSERWCEIHQLRCEDVLADAMIANSQVHPDELNAFLVRNQESFRGRIPFIWEGRFFIGNGNLRWLHIESTPIVFDNSDIRWFGVTTDITKRKQAEAALAEQKQIMAQAEELAGLGSWKWDITNDTWKLSDNWKRIHGVPDIQLTTPQLLSIAHPEDKPFIEEAFAKAVEEGKPYDIEHRIVRQDSGEVRYVHAKGLVELDDNGQPKALVGAAQDITYRKKAEEKITLINQQLERTNTEKDLLFSIIAHDLKSPMSGVFSTSKFLAEEAESMTLKEISLMSAAMHNSSRNTMTLLEELLQWARMSQGGMNFSPEECSLYELISSSLDTARDEADKKNITIQSDILAELSVMAEQAMINTVIRNVLFNAIKFTPHDGNIFITARKADLLVEICVQDSGIGISDNVLSRLFTVDKSKRQLGTDGEKGTGMGLILCKQFIEQHGGEIWVESESGQGTKVFFTLPCPERN